MEIFKYSKFKFGRQHVSQFILFEHKKLFSIIFFYFHKSNYSQDRFHTHAFNAWSIKLFGRYNEYILENKEPFRFRIEKRDKVLKYFPKNSYHKIGNSSGCLTLLFSGKWDETWEEFKDGVTTTYNHHRKIINNK